MPHCLLRTSTGGPSRPGPHVVCRWHVGRTVHTGQIRAAKRTKAAFSRSNTRSRALILRSRSRSECPALLYPAIFTHAPARRVATRRPNNRSKDQTVNSSGALIHKLKLVSPCSPRRRHIRTPPITKGALCIAVYVSKRYQTATNSTLLGKFNTNSRGKRP